jgi:hypothetical protein
MYGAITVRFLSKHVPRLSCSMPGHSRSCWLLHGCYTFLSCGNMGREIVAT